MRRHERAALRTALALLPSEFREEFGPEIARVAGERLAAAASARARLVVLAGLVADVSRQALLVRRDRWRTSRPIEAPRGRSMFGHDLRFALRTLGRRPGFLLSINTNRPADRAGLGDAWCKSKSGVRTRTAGKR